MTKTASAPAKIVRGTADLNALVRRHPGWAGVNQFDGALARLAKAQQVAAGESDPSLLSLPTEDATPPTLPPSVRQAQRQRLALLQTAQLSRLRERRARARATQIAALRGGWMRDAQAEYDAAVRAARRQYAQQARTALAADGTQRVNWVLQVQALSEIVSAWKKSTPPTPELNTAKAELAQKRAELLALDAAQAQGLSAARQTRNNALTAALATQNGFVNTRAAQAEARLLAADTAQERQLQARLTAQRAALVQAQEVRPVPTVAAAGALNTEVLPSGPVLVALSAPTLARSAARLQEARASLEAQRTRWVSFLRDDTRAAAEDAARQHHWILTFGPAQGGLTDLTEAVGRTLTQDTWKQKDTRT